MPAIRAPRRLFRLTYIRLAFFLPLLQCPVSVSAQPVALTSNGTDGSSQGVHKGWNEFAVLGSVSLHSPVLLGQTPSARFGSIGVRYSRVLLTSKNVAFSWTIDAVPLAVISTKRLEVVPSGSGFVIAEKRKTAYGWGVSPIGLKFNFRRQQQVQPFVAASGGLLYFNEDVPVEGAARFNYTFDFSGGIQIVKTNHRALTVGYKYQHISNGGRSSINPGVDAQMVFVGWSVFR